MATVNLWPDEIATDGGLEGPIVVLKEQAVLLGQATKSLVEAEVENLSDGDDGYFIDDFTIVGPTINYRHTLFSITYPIDFYPAFIEWNGYDVMKFEDDNSNVPVYSRRKYVTSREDLEKELKIIFSHPKTIRLIQALISRARS